MTFLACAAKLMLARRLVSRSGEVLVATSPTSAARDYQAFVRTREVVNALTAVGVIKNGANRNLQHDIVTFRPAAVRALAMASTLALVLGIEAEVHQRVMTLARFHDDVTAASAVAARWSSPRYELLSTKGHAAIPAVARLHSNFGFIDEH